ncbi:MAG: hypothetical protein ACXVZI_13280 [Terriglobales bacterium]
MEHPKRIRFRVARRCGGHNPKSAIFGLISVENRDDIAESCGKRGFFYRHKRSTQASFELGMRGDNVQLARGGAAVKQVGRLRRT